MIPFKYINISNIHYTVDSLYLKLGVSKMLEAAKELSHKYISQIKLRILEKHYPSNILPMILPALIVFGE